MRRRDLLCGLAVAVAAPATALGRAETGPITIYKTESCGCCNGWVRHMASAGFPPRLVVVENLTPLSEQRGVPFSLSSCHMGEVAGYAIFGHVPAEDVKRLLRERPAAIGLSVPGMPMGSPGMEAPNGESQAYETLLILAGGRTRVFARHPAKA